MKKQLPLLTIIPFLLAMACLASGRTITVDDDELADFDNIQTAINEAIDGDVVIVQPGVYSGPGNRDIDFRGKAITVRSTDPNDYDVVSATVIDCNGSQEEYHRGFRFYRHEGHDSVLAGLTIIRGYHENGGGIRCFTASPTIMNCKITNCTAYNYSEMTGGGGGICCHVSGARILDCTITGNRARYYGGGIYCFWRSSPTISGCEIFNNSGERQGGGIFCYRDSNPQIVDCIVRGNTYRGIYCKESRPSIINCTISSNKGGVMYYQCPQTSKIINSDISGNTARFDGGGIRLYGSACSIIGCRIVSNKSASKSGGGFFVTNYSNLTMTNCTISANAADDEGGGIKIGTKSDVTVINSIIWGNKPDQIWDSGEGTTVIGYCDVENGWPGLGNIYADPCFVSSGYWGADEVWTDGDYHLQPGSPCIDVADNTAIPPDRWDLDGDGNTIEPTPWDLDGRPRVLDGDEDGNSVVDMGAYEFWPPIECPMHFTPKAVNLRSRGKWIKAHFVLPAGYTIEDVDTHTPAIVVGLGLHSEHVRAFSEGGSVKVEAAFDRRDFCRSGPFEGLVTVEGTLTNARCFQGAESIKIVGGNSELLADLASYWLAGDCGEPDWCDGLDLDQDGAVNFEDFALLEGCCTVTITE